MPMTIPAQLEQHIDSIITRYPSEHKRAAVLWLLHLLQEQFGFLGQEHVQWTATKLGLQPINVWELVSFYPMFTSKPRGKFHIKVCRTLSCELCGCGGILERLQKKLGVGLDQNGGDGLFTISTVECLAACGTGPVMMINDELFENLTPEKAEAIVDRIRTTGKLEQQPLPTSPAGASTGETAVAGQHEQTGLHGFDRRLPPRRRLSRAAQGAGSEETRGDRRRGQEQRDSRTRRRGFPVRHEMEFPGQGYWQTDLPGLQCR